MRAVCGILALLATSGVLSHTVINYNHELIPENFQFTDCPDRVIIRDGLNKYNENVTVYFLRDKNGKDANKRLDQLGVGVSLHGYWPKPRCYDDNGVIRSVKSFMEKQVISQSWDLKKEYNEIRKFIIDKDYRDKWISHTGKWDQWYNNEYKKHFFNEGYNIDKFFMNVEDSIENLKIKPLSPHECMFSKDEKINRVTQLVTSEKPEKNSCKKKTEYKIVNDNQIVKEDGFPVHVDENGKLIQKDSAGNPSLYDQIEKFFTHFEMDMEYITDGITSVRNYLSEFEGFWHILATGFWSMSLTAWQLFGKVKKGKVIYVHEFELFETYYQFILHKHHIVCFGFGVTVSLFLALMLDSATLWIISIVLNIGFFINYFFGLNKKESKGKLLIAGAVVMLVYSMGCYSTTTYYENGFKKVNDVDITQVPASDRIDLEMFLSDNVYKAFGGYYNLNLIYVTIICMVMLVNMVRLFKVWTHLTNVESFTRESAQKKIVVAINGFTFALTTVMLSYIYLNMTKVITIDNSLIINQDVAHSKTKYIAMIMLILTALNEVMAFMPYAQAPINLMMTISVLVMCVLKKSLITEFVDILYRGFLTYYHSPTGSSLLIFAASLVALIMFKYTYRHFNMWLLILEFITLVPFVKFVNRLPIINLEKNVKNLLERMGLDDLLPVYIVLMILYVMLKLNGKIVRTPKQYYKVINGKLMMHGNLGKCIKNITLVFMEILVVLAMISWALGTVYGLVRQYLDNNTENNASWFVHVAFGLFCLWQIGVKILLINSIRKVETETSKTTMISMIIYATVFGLFMIYVGLQYLIWMIRYDQYINGIIGVFFNGMPYIFGTMIVEIIRRLIAPIFCLMRERFYNTHDEFTRNMLSKAETLNQWITNSCLMVKLSISIIYALSAMVKTGWIAMIYNHDHIETIASNYEVFQTVIVLCATFAALFEFDKIVVEWFLGEIQVKEKLTYERVKYNDIKRNAVFTDDLWQELTKDDQDRVEMSKNKTNSGEVKTGTKRNYDAARHLLNETESDPTITKQTEVFTEILPAVNERDLSKIIHKSKFVLKEKKYVIQNEQCKLDDELEISYEDYSKNPNTFIQNEDYIPLMMEIDSKIKEKKTAMGLQSVGQKNAVHMEMISKAGQNLQKLCDIYSPLAGYGRFSVVQETNWRFVNFLIPYMSLSSFFLEAIHGICGGMDKLAGLLSVDLTKTPIILAAKGNAKDEITNKDIFTIEEYFRITGKTYKDLRDHIKNTDEKHDNLIPNSDTIYIIGSSKGKLFVAFDLNIVTQLEQRENSSIMGENVFGVFHYYELEQARTVRPSRMENDMTLSTSGTFGGLRYSIPKGTGLLYCNSLNMYLHETIDSMDKLEVNNDFKDKDYPDWLLGIMALSVGKVYLTKQDAYTGAEGYIGSCATVNYAGRLHIITNKHVVMGYGKEHPLRTKSSIGYVGTHKNVEARFMLQGKVYNVQMETLIAAGDDFVLYSIDHEMERKLSRALGPIGIQEAVNYFPSFSENMMKTGIYLSATRQTDRTIDDEMNKISLRNTLVQWDSARQIYNILGYTTQGMSGSPIFHIEQDATRTKIYLVGLNSAVESLERHQVHMTRIIDAFKIKDVCDSFFKGNAKSVNENCILPCLTEQLQFDMQQAYSINFCGIDVEEKWGGGIWPILKNNTLLCNKGKYDEQKKAQYFWNIYNHEMMMSESPAKIDHDLIAEMFENCAVSTEIKHEKLLEIDMRSEGFCMMDMLKLINIIRTKDNKGKSRYDGFSFRWNNLKEYKFINNSSDTWLFNIQICKQDIDNRTIIVEDNFLHSFFASIESDDDYTTIYDKVLRNAPIDKVVTGTWLGNQLMVTTYDKKEFNLCTTGTLGTLYIYCGELDKKIPSVPVTEEEFEDLKNSPDKRQEIYNRIKNLKEDKKQIAADLEKKRRQITDEKQSYKYLEKANEYESVINDYKKKVKEFEQNNKNVQGLLQELKAQKKEIEMRYNHLMQEKRNNKKDKIEEAKREREAFKNEEKGIIDEIERKIGELRGNINEAKEQVKQLIESRRLIGENNHHKRKEVFLKNEIEELTREIEALQIKKEDELKIIKQKLKENQIPPPDKPDVQNPELSPEMTQMRKEVTNSRKMIRDIDQKIDELKTMLEQKSINLNSKVTVANVQIVTDKVKQINDFVEQQCRTIQTEDGYDSLMETATRLIESLEQDLLDDFEALQNSYYKLLDKDPFEEVKRKKKFQPKSDEEKNFKKRDYDREELQNSGEERDQKKPWRGNRFEVFNSLPKDPQPSTSKDTEPKQQDIPIEISIEEMEKMMKGQKQESKKLRDRTYDRVKTVLKQFKNGHKTFDNWGQRIDGKFYRVKIEKKDLPKLVEIQREFCENEWEISKAELDEAMNGPVEKKFANQFLGTNRYIKMRLESKTDKAQNGIVNMIFSTENKATVKSQIEQGRTESELMRNNNYAVFDKQEQWPGWAASLVDNWFKNEKIIPIWARQLSVRQISEKFVTVIQVSDKMKPLLTNEQDSNSFLYSTVVPRTRK